MCMHLDTGWFSPICSWLVAFDIPYQKHFHITIILHFSLSCKVLSQWMHLLTVWIFSMLSMIQYWGLGSILHAYACKLKYLNLGLWGFIKPLGWNELGIEQTISTHLTPISFKWAREHYFWLNAIGKVNFDSSQIS